MTAQIVSITSRQDQVWSAYLEAKERAEKSGAMADGIEAGRAWRRWLDLFMTEDQRRAVGGDR